MVANIRELVEIESPSDNKAAVDQIGELVEEIGRVVRTRRGFGVILDAKDWQFFVPHSFDCAVVQIYVRDLDVFRQRIRIDSEPVILRGDRDLAVAQIFHRLIRAMMSKFQFECRSSERESENLVTETNPEDWLFTH